MQIWQQICSYFYIICIYDMLSVQTMLRLVKFFVHVQGKVDGARWYGVVL